MVAFVSGCSSFIGKEVAIALAKRGVNIVLHYYKSKEDVIKFEKYIKDNFKVDTLVVNGDISKEDVTEMVGLAIKKFGHIDILVNNSGICNDSLFFDKDVESFRRILDVNLVGSFLLSREVAKFMLEDEKGTIIMVSSNNAIDSYYPESCDYDASKAGMINLAHNMAREFAPFIRVNTVALGWIKTKMNKDLDEEQIEKINKTILLERFGEACEVGKVIEFLAIDASYVNDAVIRVDGGVKNGY